MNRANATLVLIVVLIITNVFTVVKVVGTAGDANRTASALATSQHNQLANRTENVAKWCGAINQGRDYARYLRAKSHQTPYRLANLDCKTLEAATLMSGKK